jgi:hypothetical protein
MEDWVRAVNGLRRKLSEREEEERNKREGKVSGIAIPPRQGMSGDGTETHQGTYSTSYTTGSISGSPIATTGYFAPKMPSTAQSSYAMGSQGATPTSASIPATPLDTMNSLTAQMARVAIPRTPSVSANQSRSVSGHRDTSASSVGSSRAAAGEYMPRSAQPMQLSSDEDEPYFSDPVAGLGMSVGTTASMTPSASGMGLVMDPKKTILSAYLMKRSKGRGRKVWKKRWFFLTSQGLTYTKSHMVSQLLPSLLSSTENRKGKANNQDSRPLRHIPLSSVLDALDFESGESDSDADDSDNSPSIASSAPTRQFSQLRQGGRSRDGHGHSQVDKPHPSDDHTFRIVTAKRTFVLCAPSEEDEIKWLAAFRALLNRERWQVTSGPTSPNVGMESASLGTQWTQTQLPTITAQPPTPASQATSMSGDEPPTPSATTSQGPPSSWDQREEAQGGAQGLRGRSATFNAKRAVADVVKRYHPDSQGQVPALGQPLGGSS